MLSSFAACHQGKGMLCADQGQITDGQKIGLRLDMPGFTQAEMEPKHG